MSQPLMPKATAVWLVDNSALTFDQIAAFCGLHPLEVKGIADGDVAQGIIGTDPVASGQLTQDEIDRCSNDASTRLTLSDQTTPIARRKGPRYTPVSRRQDRPDAIAWLVRNHPELSDGQISKLVGTTKPTINAVRDRTHWNSSNIKPNDPVALSLCTQIELDQNVAKAAAKKQRIENAALKKTAKADADAEAKAEVKAEAKAEVAATPAETPAPEPDTPAPSLIKPQETTE